MKSRSTLCTIKTIEDTKKLLLQHRKITIADIQKCAPKKQTRLSKYSRHAQLISNELSNPSHHNLELMSKFFKLMVEQMSTESDLQDMVVSLLSMMYKDQCPTNPGDFNISNNVRIELMTLEPSHKTCKLSQIYRGILVPLTTSLYFDILSAVKEKPKHLRAILVNRIVYGDTMGDSKTIQVREVLTRKQLENDIELVEDYRHLSAMRVDLIIHYGELPPALVNYCTNSSVLMLPVPDYETLFHTQQMFGCLGSILFDVERDMSSDKNIVEVCLQCHTQQLQYQTKLNNASRRVRKDIPACGFVQLQPSPQMGLEKKEFYYTVLLYGRGPDLASLKQESFNDLLNRVRYFLKVGSFATELVEEQICCLLSTSILEQDMNIDSLLECTPWVMADIKSFSNVFSQHLHEVFQTFQGQCYRPSDDNSFLPNFLEYKETLWKRSLECVNKIISTQNVKEFSL